jgi:pyruvate kinase
MSAPRLRSLLVLAVAALALGVAAPAHANRGRAAATKASAKAGSKRVKAKRPKIVATLGPRTQSVGKLRGMLRAGMSVARINMSHNGARTTKQMMKLLRDATRKEGRSVPVLFDLPGGKVRLSNLASGQPFQLKPGQSYALSTVPGTKTTTKVAGVGFRNLESHVSKGSVLLLDDGKVELEVTGVRSGRIDTRVVRGGQVRSRMGLAVKDVELPFPAMTGQDRRKLKIAVDNGADWIGVSFVQSARNVQAVRRALDKMGAKHVKIVAKIESKRGIANLDSIMDHSDIIMIARGDLSAAVGKRNLAAAQAKIAAQARGKGVEFMVATGLVSNMLSAPKPSAANRRDIRRTVEQGPSYLMLNETAISPYPVEAVQAVKGELGR